MLTCDADPHFVDVDISLVGCLINSLGDGVGCLRNTFHNTMLHTYRLRFAEAKDLDLSVFAPHTDEAGYLRSTDVEADNDFVCHNIYCYLFIFFVQTTWLLNFRLILE